MSSKNVKAARRKRKEELVYIMGGKCSRCGYDNCIAALEFHHINPDDKLYGIAAGDCKSLETDIEEIKKCSLLCSNCHKEVEYLNLPAENTFDEDRCDEIRQSHLPTVYKCEICGKVISVGAKKCLECSNTSRSRGMPDREVLKELIRTTPFLKIGEKFGVSDNAVRKWCIKLQLPSRKKDIRNYSDEEWERI